MQFPVVQTFYLFETDSYACIVEGIIALIKQKRESVLKTIHYSYACLKRGFE